MAKYIKSHSNYRLSNKHQETKKGTILERDISTIGGVDSFATGQTTIYSSGNFVMTINTESSSSRHIIKQGWLTNNEKGEIWNAEVLRNITSDINGSVEKTIHLKNDFMDLRAFACYGSLYNLIQTSITDILTRYPYELYTGDGGTTYEPHTLIATVDNTSFIAENAISGDTLPHSVGTTVYEFKTSGTPVNYISNLNGYWYEMVNPANINLHSNYVENINDSDVLRYFCNEGYNNYSIFTDEFYPSPEDGYSFTWTTQELNVTTIEDSSATNIDLDQLLSGNTYANTHRVIEFKVNADIIQIISNGITKTLNKRFQDGDIIYVRVKDNTLEITENYCPAIGDYVADINLDYRIDNLQTPETRSIKILAFIGEDSQVKYLIQQKDLLKHIRPKPSLSFYDDFIEKSDLFQKSLLGVYSGQKNVAKFEVLNETDNGTTKTIQTFTLPTGQGDYNLDVDSGAIYSYIQTLAKIGLRYDENYTDNMYRMLTHESLKNFDWTKDFNGNNNDYDNEYTQNGEKFKSIIRIMGYIFDGQKSKIDSIRNINTITYNSRSNLADYFLTDTLECDGWDVNKIYPFELKEYHKNSKNEVTPDEWDEATQVENYYLREFSEITNDIITPYKYCDIAQIPSCDNDSFEYEEVEDHGQIFHSIGDTVVNVVRTYRNNDEYTIPDVNNNFMKRLRINSKQLLRKKGTVDGIESLLALFGLKSSKWCTENKKGFQCDFDIIEYVAFTPPIEETWDSVHDMYRIDFLNSCKTIPYNTQSYIDGEYIPYQGLPVAYRDTDDTESELVDSNNNPVKKRKLYPNFESNGLYDGGMYYQMNGGWLNFSPYFFDTHSNLVMNFNRKVSKETLRNVRQVPNLQKLLNQSLTSLNEGSIFYVNDLTNNYAIINGQIYELFTELNDNNKEYHYFIIKVNNGSVLIGDYLFENYLEISNPYNENGKETYFLPNLEDGFKLRIYWIPNDNGPFYIHAYDKTAFYKYATRTTGNGEQLRSLESVEEDEPYDIIDYINEVTIGNTNVFYNGSYGTEDDNLYTNYFKLNNLNQHSLLGEDYGWSQLKNTDSDYLKTSSIIDCYKGNNPHTGGYGYDNGKEYILRFKRLFKTALEDELVDTSCFLEPSEVYNEMQGIGFSGLTSSGDDYLSYLHADSKSHAFCDKLTESGGTTVYDLNDVDSLNASGYEDITKNYPSADGVPSQIINTKVLDIVFYLKTKRLFSKETQERIKYIQDVIMPYLEQMLPSTAIINIKFDSAENSKWVLDEGDGIARGHWHDNYFWLDDRIWIDDENDNTV